MNNCSKCHDLCVKYEIQFPSHFKKALAIAKENVEDGTLEVIKDRGSKYHTDFNDISANGPCDDLVSYKFRCTNCGRIFELSAETYHGSGEHGYPLANKQEYCCVTSLNTTYIFIETV